MSELVKFTDEIFYSYRSPQNHEQNIFIQIKSNVDHATQFVYNNAMCGSHNNRSHETSSDDESRDKILGLLLQQDNALGDNKVKKGFNAKLSFIELC